MKHFDWDLVKNALLKSERDVGFEDIVVAISEGRLIDVIEHPNKDRYRNQKIFIVAIVGYAYLVPFVEDEKIIFLKTVIPSRKATRDYLGKKR